jgi:hypothetical protein
MRMHGAKTPFEKAFPTEAVDVDASRTVPSDAGALVTGIAQQLFEALPMEATAARSEAELDEARAQAQGQATRFVETMLKSTSGSHVMLDHLDQADVSAILDMPSAAWAHMGKWGGRAGGPPPTGTG